MSDKRIDDLEIMAAHQQQEIHDLSDMVDTLRREVETLKARLERTQSRLSGLEDNLPDGEGKHGSVSDFAESQKPPHY